MTFIARARLRSLFIQIVLINDMHGGALDFRGFADVCQCGFFGAGKKRHTGPGNTCFFQCPLPQFRTQGPGVVVTHVGQNTGLHIQGH
jgi:hypothetical protein